MATLEIRPYQPEDFSEFLDLYRGIFPHKNIKPQTLDTLFANPNAKVWLLGTNPQKRVPNQIHEFYGFLYFISVCENIDIIDIGVAEPFRRRGYGQRLLKRLIAEAELNNQKLFLEVAVTNHPAVALYKSNGFQVLNIRKNYYRHENDQCDALSMVRNNYPLDQQ